jgi:hypothetical protein
MGYQALAPITHRNFRAPSFLLVFEDGQIAALESLEEEYIEQAIEGVLRIIRVDDGQFFEMSDNGQSWRPIKTIEDYVQVA